jgi:transposase InsO family protein
MKTFTSTEKDRETAYLRFALIAPVIQGIFPDASERAYCRRIAQTPVKRQDGLMFRYSPATIQRWICLYKEGGMDALLPRERSDKGRVKSLSQDCIREIHQIREKYPRLDAIQIHLRLVRDGFLPANVSPRTIQRFVKANGLKPGAASGPLKDRKAFEEAFFGSMWAADTCYFPYIRADGAKKRTYLIAAVDDHSRMIVGAELFFEDNAYNFQKVLKRAVAAYGIPNKLYVDHGSAYENSQLSFICGSIGAVLIHAPVRDGAAKAKIERTFGTLKSRWLYGLDTDQIFSLSAFNQELAEQVRKHNLTVNSSTGQTPMDRFLKTREKIRIPESEDWLNECFMNRVRRKVRNDATLSLQNTQFDAPMQFIRQTVEVRFLPDALWEAYIFDSNVRYPLKLTDKQANSRVRRENGPTVDYSKGGTLDV